MKAVVLRAYGDTDQLHYEEVPTPEPKAGEVLVKVRSTSVNPIDYKLRSGVMKDMWPLELPAILGNDVAGRVEKLGTGVTAFDVGQNVFGYVQGGGYAEYVVATAEALAIIPEGLVLEEAGALPLVITTGAQLAEHLNLKAGQTVLITGALGSVGRTAVYVAKLQGARVFVAVRKKEKQEAGALGADQVIAVDNDAEISALPQLDAIADTVGPAVIGKLIPKLKSGGILGSVLGKPKEAEGKDIYVEAFSAQPDPDRLQQLARAVAQGKFSIPIARTFTLSEAGQAHKLAEGGGAKGKLVLVP